MNSRLFCCLSIVRIASAMTLRKPPKLIVFDLDNTIWTPELYQLRRSLGDRQTPVAGKHVKLFPGASDIIEKVRNGEYADTQFAVASRTKSVPWAFDLLEQFQLHDVFTYLEIFPSSKEKHFSNLASASGFDYSDMLFFDDARDGKFGNCVPVANMGVLSVHCPRGLESIEIFDQAMKYYTKHWNGSPGVVVEHDGTVNERLQGIVKTVMAEKNYGFIRISKTTNDIFFSFRSLPNGMTVQKGDPLSFVKATDSRNGKTFAADIQLEKDSSSNIELEAFSMGMPFAALLMNGFKTLETRNNLMFQRCKPGSKLLIHVGQRDFDDGDKHLQILRRNGLDDAKIRQLKTMPSGFVKGSIVGVCEIGQTYELSRQQRCEAAIEDKVVAFGADSGKIVTEIRRIEYLRQPVACKGQPGIFTVPIDSSLLPEGWNTDSPKEEKQPNKPVYTITG